MLDTEISCRLIKVVLENGDVEILYISLLDIEKYDINRFRELYHYRWNEEEAYKLLKSRIELEAFSGKTAKAVKQDFHAKVFLLTMCAAYAHPIEEKVIKEYKADKNRKHSQKINRTVPMFIKKQFETALEAFDDIVFKTRGVIRPIRRVPRHKRPEKQHHMNYKTTIEQVFNP